MGVQFGKLLKEEVQSWLETYLTIRVKASLAEQHVCEQCQPWSFGFILLVEIFSGALNFDNRLKDGKATWLQITWTRLLVNWLIGTFSVGTVIPHFNRVKLVYNIFGDFKGNN